MERRNETKKGREMNGGKGNGCKECNEGLVIGN